MISNKQILITGASRGIGRDLALLLANQHNTLGLIARSQTDLSQLAAECEAMGSSVRVFAGDVSDESFVQESVQRFMEDFGSVDFLINNAGFGVFKQAEEFTSEEWDRVMEVNVKGTFLWSKHVLPGMKLRKSGHIINIASDVAKRTFSSGALYCASKYAQDAYSSALRKEVQPYSIKVSVIYSGLVDTHFHKHPQGAAEAESWLKGSDMANAIHYVMNQPPHVVIDELMIHPISQAY